MSDTKTVYAGYPSAFIYDKPEGKKKKIQHCLWGDWLQLKAGRSGDYCEVHARGTNGWIHKDEFQEERLLEIVFVDIGQGDGCLIVTPEDKHMIIDAGVGDNMARFLKWRYGGFKKKWVFESAVISHPDSDHYKGFGELFKNPNVKFKTIYHNGIMERNGSQRLGPKTSSGSPRYLTDIIRTHKDMETFLADTSNYKKPNKQYPAMLKKVLDNEVCENIRMLCHKDGHMPGYGPEKELNIRVLAPLLEGDDNAPRLRWINSTGKTKNGHSVVLKLQYRDVSLMLGGDLNIPAEEFLLEHYTGIPCPPKNFEQHQLLVEAARKTFQVDITKSCHHGSADFSTTFLAALNPLVTVISSGDDEPHAHPRSDTLGTIGRFSRGARPLICSTELARSTKENIKHPYQVRQEFRAVDEQWLEHNKAENQTSKTWKKKNEQLKKKKEKLLEKIERSVAVYGAINVRTDGHNVVIAQKLERPRSGSKWDMYRLESHHNGTLTYQSKH